MLEGRGTVAARRVVLPVTLIVLAAALVYWPAVHGFYVLDDFMLVTISRFVGAPLAFFSHSHFPGGAFYRPFAMTFWWASIELAGVAPRNQYLISLTLHIGVGIALWRVLRAVTQSPWLSVLAAVGFVVHPIAIGTAVWLSDRFDLLAALFTLLAIGAAWRYRQTARTATLVAIFLYAALATLSKEIGFAVYLPVVLILLAPAPPSSPSRAVRAGAAAAVALLAVVLFVVRGVVLGAALDQHYIAGVPIAQMIAEGCARGARYFIDYTIGAALPQVLERVAVAIGASLFLVWIALGAVRANTGVWRSERSFMALGALALVVAAGVLQSPTVRLMGLSDAATSAQWAVVNSRVFYLALIGLLLLLGVLAGIAAQSLKSHWLSRGVAVAVIVLCILPWAVQAHRLARQYRKGTQVQMTLVHAAQEAIARLPLPAEHCRVYLLDVPQAQESDFSKLADAAIKNMSAVSSPASTCLFQTERTPWFYIVKRGSLTPASAAPMHPMPVDGKPAPWLQFGDVEIGYLNLAADIDAASQRDAFFLTYSNGRFVDVTSDVLSRRRAVAFRCDRVPEQCVLPAASVSNNTE